MPPDVAIEEPLEPPAPGKSNGVVEINTDRPVEALHELTVWALERGVGLPALEVRRASLEDVYLRLTDEGDQ